MYVRITYILFSAYSFNETYKRIYRAASWVVDAPDQNRKLSLRLSVSVSPNFEPLAIVS